ncbi:MULTISPECIES: hypothetical protein [unclassified Bosea (in: a-proteobacteria)]|uniref:hypothetical protein n=1 Tax=unclassified Bosea (in: a-proteobacteria) TaxID=2653178 RepID=UPI000F7E300D|nr:MULTISPECIES: hypothetical protein [unclassified Bosea (in: a-proteobacteria)]
MHTQPKRSGLSDKIAAHLNPAHLELYREICHDEDGKRYAVIVYRPFPDVNVTRYELEDGTPVRFIADCLFEIESTGRTLTRCEP